MASSRYPDPSPTVVQLADCIVLHLVTEPETQTVQSVRGLYLVVHKTFGFLAAINEGLMGAHSLISKFGVEVGRKLIASVTGELKITTTEYSALYKDLGHKVVRIII